MKKILLAAVVVVALIGGWSYASPWWTLRQMREAAQARDSAAMSAYVDYPALREDVKGDFREFIRKDQEQPESGLKSAGSAFAMAIVGSIVIDRLVSPEAVQTLFRAPTVDVNKAPADQSQSPIAALAPGEKPVVERVSLDEFRVRSTKDAEGAMVFRRSGLGWKLAGVDLPER